MKNSVFVEKKVSKSGKEFLMLNVDLGYKVIAVTFNDSDISAICDSKLSDLYAMENGSRKDIGYIQIGD